MSRAVLALAVASVLVSASPARAQRYGALEKPRLGSFEAGVGAMSIGGLDFGEQRANEQRNPTTGSDPLLLFLTRSRLDAAPGLQLRFGMYLTRRLAAEAGFRYSQPVVVTRITDDFEQASDTVAKETLSEYIFDGSLVFHLARFGGGRFIPFVQGGAGQVRDLHQRGELVETGAEYHGGGGLKLWFGSGSHRLGVRGDVAASSRSGAFDLQPRRRTVPIAGVSLLFLF